MGDAEIHVRAGEKSIIATTRFGVSGKLDGSSFSTDDDVVVRIEVAPLRSCRFQRGINVSENNSSEIDRRECIYTTIHQ